VPTRRVWGRQRIPAWHLLRMAPVRQPARGVFPLAGQGGNKGARQHLSVWPCPHLRDSSPCAYCRAVLRSPAHRVRPCRVSTNWRGSDGLETHSRRPERSRSMAMAGDISPIQPEFLRLSLPDFSSCWIYTYGQIGQFEFHLGAGSGDLSPKRVEFGTRRIGSGRGT